MKKLFKVMPLVSLLLLGSASTLLAFEVKTNQELFKGEWDFHAAQVIAVISTKDQKKWTMVSCQREAYLETGKCLKVHHDSKPTYFVLDKEMGGLCSTSDAKYCWTFLTVQKSRTRDLLVEKADPFNTEPGVGFAISAYRLAR